MAAGKSYSDVTWLGSDQLLARRVGRPINRFMSIEASGGIVLLFATAVALIWANSPWDHSYHALWGSELSLNVGNIDVFTKAGLEHFTLEEFVNDALMAVFFFVIGLEIKRELVVGQLRKPRDAALPAIAALGGMVVPAAIYYAFNKGGVGADGWGIPMATDIAFAVGVMSLLGPRIPRTLRVFLLSLAIVDDIGAILVIAFFYTEELSWEWLAVAGGLGLVVIAMRQAKVWWVPIYVIVGAFMWWATFKSGIHATIAGVALGLMAPAKPLQTDKEASKVADWLRDKPHVFVADLRFAAFHIRESTSITERLEDLLHPFTAYLIVPIFALANAGVPLSGAAISDATTSAVTLGVGLGLILGKTIGVTVFALAATRSGLATMPAGCNGRQIGAVGILAGIGFTVSLFVTGLAFDDPGVADQAKIGILAASAIATIAGLAALSAATPKVQVGAVSDD